MPDGSESPAPAGVATGYDPASAEYRELRELLLGPERRRLLELERRLNALKLSPEELAEVLPEAIALRAARDRQLGQALAPTVENALRESVRRSPREIATAIFPVLGPAIRKAIAETMAGLVRSINAAIEHSLSLQGLRWRVEAWRTGVPYAQIVLRHALVYRVEQIFLIHADTGLLLLHAAAADRAVADADLVSGMLTAIQDFVSDSFRAADEGARLRTFSVGELTVMVEPGPQALLAAVVRGQPPDSVLHRLQSVLETIHVQFGARLLDFDGDAAPFEASRPLLEECLETVLSTDRARPVSRAWRLAWVGAALVVLAVVGWRMIGAERRWRAGLDALAAEPGLVVVRAERDWGRWQIDGLRDPIAREPAAVLAARGLDATRLWGRWDPYLSLEPAVVRERARIALAAPAAVGLDLRGDTLLASGPAPVHWLGAMARGVALPPGVAALDLSATVPALAPEPAARLRDLERTRVFFAVGSATLGPEAVAVVTQAAAGVREIVAALAGSGYVLQLALDGRTDQTGSEAGNQTLSQRRADAVRAALIARGTPPALVAARGLGLANPLPATPEVNQAAMNRSVTFSVTLAPPGRAQ